VFTAGVVDGLDVAVEFAVVAGRVVVDFCSD